MQPGSENLTITRVDVDETECGLGLRFPDPQHARSFAKAVSALLDQDLSLEIHPAAGGPLGTGDPSNGGGANGGGSNGNASRPDVPGMADEGHDGETTNGGSPEAGHRSRPHPPGTNGGAAGALPGDGGSTPSDVEVLARGLRHDLKSPLSAVTTYLRMIQDDADLTPASRSHLDEAIGAAARIQDILEAVGDYGAVGGGDAVLVDLDDALDDALENLGEAADRAAITREPLPTVRGLRGDLVRLLQNLVGNALAYGGDGARVQVTATRGGDGWILRVADDGPGIPEDEQERIFDPLERGAASGGTQGSGLGLALCRRVAEAHGGSVGVDSSPGDGATFWVTFPATASIPA